MHEEETREGARDASLQRMDLAEERLGLYGNAIETGRERSDRMGVTSHTSVIKVRQRGIRALYPALRLRKLRRMRLMVSWDTPYSAAAWRKDSWCSITRRTTLGHSEWGNTVCGVLWPWTPMLQNRRMAFFRCFILGQQTLYLLI
jgi:hypothetical protein